MAAAGDSQMRSSNFQGQAPIREVNSRLQEESKVKEIFNTSSEQIKDEDSDLEVEITEVRPPSSEPSMLANQQMQ